MATELNIEILNRETIKPSFPTQNHNKFLNFSLLDQLAPVAHVGVLLFFSRANLNCKTDPERSELLRKSLSQTLTSFYPFAGRIRDNAGIDCNDEGAEFIETRVKSPLSTFAEKPDSNMLMQLFPYGIFNSTEKDKIGTIPLLVVQANFFDCGGMAISVSVSHKAADVSTISTFLNCWAANASESSVDSLRSPQFLSQPLFPPRDSLASHPPDSFLPFLPENGTLIRRMVFSGPRVAALRSELASKIVSNPTRVEAVEALIWRCAMEASESLKSTPLCQSGFFQAVNLRRRLTPAMPENSCGNFSWSYSVLCKAREAEMQDLMALLRKGIEELSESRARPEDLIGQLMKKNLEMSKNVGMDATYLATSWCRFPFYSVDFGWGKPWWVCVPSTVKNGVVLIDGRDGDDGIEALLSLGQEEMAYFERNPKVLDFASFSPSEV